MKRIISIIIGLLFSNTLFAANKDLLPHTYKYTKGEVQAMTDESLTHIDNSVVYLNPDENGKHSSIFFYKAKNMDSIPFLEVRAKVHKGAFKIEISSDGGWKPVGTLTEKKKGKFQELKFDLQDHISAFKDKKGLVKVRITSIEKAKTLEIDYIGITADQATTTASNY